MLVILNIVAIYESVDNLLLVLEIDHHDHIGNLAESRGDHARVLDTLVQVDTSHRDLELLTIIESWIYIGSWVNE